VFYWGTATLSGGTVTPRAVPTWTWLRATELGVAPACPVCLYEGGAPPGHRHWWGGATATFIQRAREVWLVTATITAMPRAVYHHIFTEACVFVQLGGWSPPPCPVTTASQTSRWNLPLGGTAVFGDLTEDGRCHHRHVRRPRRGWLHGVTVLFACGLINRGCGRPWPLSWHF